MAVFPNEKIALFFLKYVFHFSFIFALPIFLHFCLVLSKISKKRKMLILISYLISGILQVFNFTGHLASVTPLYPFRYYIKPGSFYIIFIALFFIYILYALFEVFQRILKVPKFRKKRLICFFIGALTGLLIVSTIFLPVFKLSRLPYGVYIFPISIFITFCALIRYHLMNTYINDGQDTAYNFVVTCFTIIYVGIVFVVEQVMRSLMEQPSPATRFFVGFTISVTFIPVRNRIKKLINKFIFIEKKVEHYNALQYFSQNLIAILDLRQLVNIVMQKCRQLLKADKICLVLYDNNLRKYRALALNGLDNSLRKTKFSPKHRIIKWFKSNHEAALISELIKKNIDNKYSFLIKQMKLFQSEIAVPLFFEKNLEGILFLSKKRDGYVYTLDEFDFFRNFGNQAAIAFSNALSFNDLKRIYLSTMESFISVIEAKDGYTKGHSDRVVSISVRIAREIGISRYQIELLKFAGVLHDIGKIGIANKVLTKKKTLSEIEYDKIKKASYYRKKYCCCYKLF